uniref:Uncharacterized protein n=1 Tax=Arundo donax TaxID=35708 RepID=A0A0A8YX34_ARUDO
MDGRIRRGGEEIAAIGRRGGGGSCSSINRTEGDG